MPQFPPLPTNQSAPLGIEPPGPPQAPELPSPERYGGMRGTPGGVSMIVKVEEEVSPEMAVDLEETERELGRTDLVNYFRSRWIACRDGRRTSGIEREWLDALLAFNGEYSSEMRGRLEKLAPNRSRAFVKLARSVVGGARALIMQAYNADPSGFPWQIRPAADPDTSGIQVDTLMEARDLAAAQIPDPVKREEFLRANDFEEALAARRADANTRCAGMSKVVQDNFDEMSWTERFLRSIDPLTIYGTSVFVGPQSVRKNFTRWHKDADGKWTTALARAKKDDVGLNGESEPIDITTIRPDFQLRDLWSCYPDPVATSRENMKDVFFRDVISRHQLLGLRRLPNVRADVIAQLVSDFPDIGNWTAEPWEASVESMTSENQTSQNGDRFVVLEFFGFISGEKLHRAGVEIPEGLRGEECLVNAMICDDRIIKCVVSNMEPPEVPVYFVPYEVVPQRLFGRGIPAQMDDSQDRFNAVERAKMDNLGITALPQIWLDISRITDPSKADNMFPGKTWAFNDTSEGVPMGLIQINSIVGECINIQQSILLHIQKETNLPDFALGIASSTAHNRTAGGLEIQRDQALAFIRGVVGNIDVFLTTPMVKSLYDWNMSFNPNDDIKGAYDVVAKGVTGAVAREVIAERIGALLHQWGDELKFWLRPDKAVPMWLNAMGLEDAGVVNSPKEAAIEKQKQAEREAMVAGEPQRIQPITPKENAIMAMFQRTDSNSPMFGPIYEKALEQYGIGSERIAAALDAINRAAALTLAPLLTPEQQAAIGAPVTGIVTGQPVQQPGPVPPNQTGQPVNNVAPLAVAQPRAASALEAGGAVNAQV